MTDKGRWIDRLRVGGRRNEDLDVILAENRLGRYAVPRSAAHRVAAQRVLAGKVYEPRTIRLIRQECRRGDVVHAGTFFGDFLPGISSKLAPGALVHAFEPNPESWRCARRTVELNQLTNVRLHQVGLGPGRGKDRLLTVDADGAVRGGASRLVRTDEVVDEGAVTERIRIDSIDARVPADRRVSVLQLDVEGHEQAALTGALATITRCRPVIILESMPDPAWFDQHLLPLGYQVAEKVHHNTVLRPAGRERPQPNRSATAAP